MLDDNCEIVGVVKANAYGHGAVEVASYFESIGIKHFAVACISEGIELRNGDIKGEIRLEPIPVINVPNQRMI